MSFTFLILTITCFGGHSARLLCQLFLMSSFWPPNDRPQEVCVTPLLRQTARIRVGILAVLLSLLLSVMPVLADDTPSVEQTPAAQAPGPQAQSPQAPAPPTIESLKVIPLAGRDEVNDIQRRVMAPLVVEVLDHNDRPVQNAEVVFRFPLQGPGATFPGAKTSLTARTNGQGQVAAMNWMANNEIGRFDVHVSAS